MKTGKEVGWKNIRNNKKIVLSVYPCIKTSFCSKTATVLKRYERKRIKETLDICLKNALHLIVVLTDFKIKTKMRFGHFPHFKLLICPLYGREILPGTLKPICNRKVSDI